LSGRGRLVLLSGEPGVGKTRLADEFSTIAASRGAGRKLGEGKADEGDVAGLHMRS
jgi:MoxR-like ATPase